MLSATLTLFHSLEFENTVKAAAKLGTQIVQLSGTQSLQLSGLPQALQNFDLTHKLVPRNGEQSLQLSGLPQALQHFDLTDQHAPCGGETTYKNNLQEADAVLPINE